MHVDGFLSDFVDDSVLTGNDLAVLGQIQLFKRIRDGSAVWEGFQLIDGGLDVCIAALLRFVAKLLY